MARRRGDVYYARLSPVKGSEQDLERPVLVVSGSEYNRRSKTVVVMPMTKTPVKPPLGVKLDRNGPSYVLPYQTRTIDKLRFSTSPELRRRLDVCTPQEVDACLDSFATICRGDD